MQQATANLLILKIYFCLSYKSYNTFVLQIYFCDKNYFVTFVTSV